MNFDGGRFGAFAGYNVEIAPSIIGGIDGDLGYDFSTFGGTLGATAYTGKFGLSGAVRGRLGVSVDKVLLYAAGGYAASAAQETFAGVTYHTTLHGFTAGAGADFKLVDNVFARAEYRYNYLTGRATIAGTATRHKLHQHAFNFGVAYKF